MILGGGAVSAYVAPLQPQSSARPHRASSAAAVVASAKRLRRWRRPSPEEDDAGEYPEGTPEAGGGVLEFLTNLDSEAPPPPPTPAVSAGGSSLRGADVLQALQRRAAAGGKGAAAGGGRGAKVQRSVATRGSGGGGGDGQGEARDYSNVRPLEIKSDWAARLDELDSLVQELQAQQQRE
ncbi:unnamed protein product [Spirodela intermedia]|uniref:Uncharacterized protein n=1 Tax=Spirodela intermedia TaxID=51605 RepID=A0A7I8L0C2_SPIIN|nr:unnamed protein product [Spirodela intermedia]